MLTPEGRQNVRAALEDILLRVAVRRTFVINLFSPDETPILKECDQGPDTAHDYSAAILRACIAARWTNTPQSLMERLLTDLITRGKIDLVPLRDSVRQCIDPILDPLNSSWITADQPFFGRLGTRPLVKELLDKSDKPIMLTQGEEKSGKTYTGEWLDYLAAEERCNFAIVVERLGERNGPTMTPDLLAESLVDKLGRPRADLPVPPESVHRWEKRLCNWIIAQALSKKEKVWIVLDGFDDPDLDRRTAALIQELAGEVLKGEINRKVRIILIDFRSKLVQVDDVKLLPDLVPSPINISPVDLEDCLKQHLTCMGVAADASFVTALAIKLFDEAEQMIHDPQFLNEPRLKRLNRVVYNFRQKDLARPRTP